MRSRIAVGIIFLLFYLFIFTTSYLETSRPKYPSLKFVFSFSIPIRGILGGELYLCKNDTCSDYDTMVLSDEAHNSMLYCPDAKNCWGYIESPDPSKFFRLRIDFGDKSRISNTITRYQYFSDYDVEVFPDYLVISPQKSIFSKDIFFLSLLLGITIIIDLGVIRLFNQKKKITISWWSIVIGNLISFPMICFIFYQLPWPTYLIMVFSEISVIILESGLIFIVNKKSGISFKQSLTAGFTINAASTIAVIAMISIGLAIMTVINLFFLLF